VRDEIWRYAIARRKFSREFKLEAVRLAQQSDVSVAEVARDLGLHDHVLRRWIRKYEEDPANAFPRGGQMKPQDAEVAALKREIKKLKVQRNILKKATAFFAKESS